jgi:hypothetical protein
MVFFDGHVERLTPEMLEDPELVNRLAGKE